MNDLIERQAAIDALGEEPEVWTGKDEYAQGLNNQWHYDVNALKAVPSAQSERKKGRWIQENIVLTTDPPQYQWHCSECGRLVHWFTSGVLTNFCPSCGADMRGEQ